MNQKNNKNSILNVIWDWVKTLAIALFITFFIKIFIMDATRVSGASMSDTLHHNDLLLVNKIGARLKDSDRGDIVILRAPDFPGRIYIKRVIGTPGDTVEIKDGEVLVNGEILEEDYVPVDYTEPKTDVSKWELSDDQYLVFGDNRANSNDSRDFGKIYKEDIIGHAFFRFYPFYDIGLIDKDPYNNN